MKLWQKNTTALQEVEHFTVGNDRHWDLQLAEADILGNMAHARMLQKTGLLTETEQQNLHTVLLDLLAQAEAGSFTLDDTVEDIHSQVEFHLTEKLGDTGKKIHTARSRNDQVLVDLKLFLRKELQSIVEAIQPLFVLLQQKSEQHQNNLLPGYTHLQLAMPSSFGLWFGAYAESLADDLLALEGAYRLTNKNPLGSAAGYGSSFPIDRSYTTQLLGFDSLHYNVVYAQMGRGKTERQVAMALSSVADTLARMAMDMCLFMNQEFGYVSFPDELTTGSSIMPHKKNPDVWEIIRGRCNRIKALPNEIMLLTTNLPSGYHREFQLLKEQLFPALQSLKECLHMAGLMIENVRIRENILDDDKYKYLFSVEMVNQLVTEGVPFREAYKTVGLAIEAGTYTYHTDLHHTHEGSIGNLCNQEIASQLAATLARFPFSEVAQALEGLKGNK